MKPIVLGALLGALTTTFPTLTRAESITMACQYGDQDIPLRYTSAWRDLFTPTFEAKVSGDWVDMCEYLMKHHKTRANRFHLYRCEASDNENALFTFKATPLDRRPPRIVYYDFRNLQGQTFFGIFSLRFNCASSTSTTP